MTNIDFLDSKHMNMLKGEFLFFFSISHPVSDSYLKFYFNFKTKEKKKDNNLYLKPISDSNLSTYLLFFFFF